MKKLKIKSGDKVEVISGSNKGKKGTVLKIDAKNFKIKIEGVNVQTNYDKKDGLTQKEGFIHYSNVKTIEAKSKTSSKKSSAKTK